MKQQQITGAEGLVKSLICEGVDLIFGYPGGAIINVYDKLYDYTDRLKHILVRHEQGAIHAAQGYARVTGRPGVVVVTSGPGAANVVTGLSDALMDSTPLVVISGQVASNFLGTDAFQETDVVAMTQQITKWAIQIRHADDIPAAVARAFYIATTGRPGPVVLDISKDAQNELMDWHHTTCRFIRSYNPAPEVPDATIFEIASILNSAKKPVIIAGHGVTIAGADDALRQVAEKGNIYVGETLLGLAALPADNHYCLGMVGMHGHAAANVTVNNADVILGVGLRFDDRVTSDVHNYAPHARIIHVDIDAAELNKTVNEYMSVQGDARDVLSRLVPLLEYRERPECDETVKRYKAIEKEYVTDIECSPSRQKLTMGEVISTVSDYSGNDTICVTDVGQNQMFAAGYFKCRSSRSFLSSGGLGTMGFGLPAAIGAKIGSPDRQVCLFVGDGGIQMTIQEFGTIMAYDVPVKIVLLNNDFLGNVRQWQQLFFNGRFSQTQMYNPDFVAIAKAYGIGAEVVSSREELPDAVRRMLESKTAYLLDVRIDSTDMVFPMIVPGTRERKLYLNQDKYITLE